MGKFRYNELCPRSPEITERKVHMDGNETGGGPSSSVHVRHLLVCCILLAAFVVLKAKVSHLEERNALSSLQMEFAEKTVTEATVVSNDPLIADFMIDSGSRALMANLVELEKSAKIYYPIILKASRKHKVDPHLITAIIMAESGFNPRAVSRVGARGLMQLMPRTARSLGLKDVFNPEKNIEAGVRYFKRLLIRFNGNVSLALAAYNAGSRRINEHGGVPPRSETFQFVEKVSRLHKEFKKYDKEPVKES